MEETLEYLLMRKNDIITLVRLDEDGNMLYFSKEMINEDMAPLQDRYRNNSLKLWWKERSVPVNQGRMKKFLRENGYSGPSQYLVKNLGLSLTDYYWVKPVNSDLSWENINLFENDFKENLIDFQKENTTTNPNGIPHYSPNGSLQGGIEKTWIINNGKRYLIKGNRNERSNESMNEIIAAEIHKRQGFSNYLHYNLIKIKNRDYVYGCSCRLFTSVERELVPAWALFTSEKKKNDVSNYSHLLNVCRRHGMDIDLVKKQLEYEIMTDFVISGYDRHLNNIGFMRDADSLEFTGMAPIFDSGGALFCNKPIPKNTKELLSLSTESFVKKESNLVKLVEDKNVIDLTKLPPASFIRNLYEKDPNLNRTDIRRIACCYEKKIDICRSLQLGKDPFKTQYSIPKHGKEIKTAPDRKQNGKRTTHIGQNPDGHDGTGVPQP